MESQSLTEEDEGASSLIRKKSIRVTRVSIKRNYPSRSKEVPNTTNGQGVSANSKAANFESTNQEQTGFESTNQEPTEFKSTNPETTGFESTNQETTGFESTNQEPTGFESTNQETTGFESTNQETTGFESTNQETTRFESTNQETTGFESTNQSAIPKITVTNEEHNETASDRSSSELNDLLYSVGSSFASFMGVVGKHALNGAITVMQKTLQSVPEYREEWDDDDDDDEAVDQWHEAKYDDGDDDDDTEFEDALEQVSPRDRIHNICHELMTTEEAYVKRLSILVMAKSRVTKMLGEEVAKNLFKDIENLYQFHGEYLLPQLQDRLQNWEKFKVIGDIMKKFTPFLKLYTEYVKNFENASSLVNMWEEKSSKFASFLKEIQMSPSYGRLKIQAHMLEPVQRVPRYELLLRDYLKRLDDDSPDRDDAQKAMALVSAAASHFESMMLRDSRIGELVRIQRQLGGMVNMVSDTRRLCKQSKISSINASNGKRSERIAFLFSDILLLCTEQSLPGTKYKVKQNVDLSEAQVADGSNLDYPDTFYIKTTDKVVELGFGSAQEKMEWEKAILAQMRESTKNKLINSGKTRLSNEEEISRILGQAAPVPVHQSSTTMCMLCAAEFNTLRRKRNCRACGIVICGKCSQHTAVLPYDSSKPMRVCDECFVLLNDDTGRTSPLSMSPSPGVDSPTFAGRRKTRGACLISGFLLYSSDVGRNFKRRWFALHDSAVLYSFKAPQDINPWTSMQLEGYNLELMEAGSSAVIHLNGMGKSYQLKGESKDNLNRWYVMMAGEEVTSEEDSVTS